VTDYQRNTALKATIPVA